MSLSSFVQDILLIIVGAFVGVMCTALSGVVKLYVEPIQHFRKVNGEIASLLWRFGNVSYKSSNRGEVESELRRLAGELHSASNLIPLYNIFSFLRLVPTWRNTQIAISNLTGLANSLGATRGEAITLADHHKWEIIRTALGIR